LKLSDVGYFCLLYGYKFKEECKIIENNSYFVIGWGFFISMIDYWANIWVRNGAVFTQSSEQPIIG